MKETKPDSKNRSTESEDTLILASALATMSSRLDIEQIKTYWSLLYMARSDLRLDPDRYDFEMSLRDLKTLAGLGGKDPARLRTNIKEMIKTNVSFDFFNKDGDAEWSETGLLAGVDLKKVNDEWQVKYSFSHVIRDRILRPRIYASLDMGSVAKIKRSKYSVILYGLCADYLNPTNPYIAPPTMSVETFRSFLKLGDEYPSFADVKKFIINPAIKEINEVTELNVTCTYTTVGRKTTSVKFVATQKATPKVIEASDISKVGELLKLIPSTSRDPLRKVVVDMLASNGFDYCKSNIMYAIETTNGQNPEALMRLALLNDYAKSKREKAALEKQKKVAKEKGATEKAKKEAELEAARDRRLKEQEYIMQLYQSKTPEERAEIDAAISEKEQFMPKVLKLKEYFSEKGEL